MSRPPQDDFRHRVRTWLEAHAAAYHSGSETTAPEDDLSTCRTFLRSLHDAGLVGLTWPPDAGGAGRGARDEQIVREESVDYRLPLAPFRIGLGTVGPTIVDVGSAHQQRTLCPAILSGQAIWCQLFSEPEAGTDLAGVRTRAARVDGGFRVTGRKIWTTNAHRATMGAALVRTDPDVPKHHGISMLMVDMHSAGVHVAPLREMTGNAVFNEVLLDDVFVPDDMVLGDVDGGWAVATRMLAHERNAVSSGVGTDRKATHAVSFAHLAQAWRLHGNPADHDARGALVDQFVAQETLSLLRSRYAQLADRGRSGPADRSVTKLLIGRADLDAATAAAQILGMRAAFDDSEVHAAILAAPALSIAGGTEEIQKNLIAEHGLGLPREPDPTRGLSFREINAGRAEGN